MKQVTLFSKRMFNPQEEPYMHGTCVGTGTAFDPAFYCHRPINVFAAHGYGSVF